MEIYRFGELIKTNGFSAADMEAVLDDAHARKAALQELPLGQILDLLHKVGRAWADPDYGYRRQAVEVLPDYIRFSGPMIEQGILTLVELLTRSNMEKRLDCDLGDAGYLDDWVYHPRFGGHMMAQPHGVVAHVSAGNVFVGGVDTLIQGIVTKNVNLMKMASIDPLFPVLFARSLRDHDDTGIVAGSLALLGWKGGDVAVETVLKQRCDAIVVYGGADTVRSYRQDLGLHTKLIEYGPKYSFALIADDELKRRGLKEVTRAVARDATMWEQGACSSPHMVYVEDPDGQAAETFAKALATELEGWAEQLPAGRKTEDEGVEILRVRELAKVEQAMGSSLLLQPCDTDWTVVLQRAPDFQTSCLFRTLYVKPVKKLEDALEAVRPMGAFLQTVAILADEARTKALGRVLTRIGADRIVAPGRMARRQHGTPHDGTRGLAELVRWSSIGQMSEDGTAGKAAFGKNGAVWTPYDPQHDAFDYLPDAERDAAVLAELRKLIADIRPRSSFYAERLKGFEPNSLKDLARLPVLTADELKAHLPPSGHGLITDESAGGFVFASGGTSGAPKVAYRTAAEHHYNAARMGKGLLLAGFGQGDVVANLMFAGNMWASFISLNMALEHTGARFLPLAGNMDMEFVLFALKHFRANSIISIPTVLLSIARLVEERKIEGLELRKAATGGEHLFPGARAYLSRVLGIETFASAGYAANDSGAIGYQCDHCHGGSIHHVHEDLHYVEIVDPDTLEPVPTGEVGKIIATNLNRRLMPMLRYDIGDLGRWIEGPCGCGRTTRRFELMGRSDDVLNFGAAKLGPDVVAQALKEVPGLSPVFQMIARFDGVADQLVVRVERDPAAQDEAVLGERLAQQLRSSTKELKTFLERKLIGGIAVEVLAPGGLPRNPRTGKVRLVVEERTS
ncbi:AMP-binding protein [Rhodopseudomonas pseudopalustris]|uniref:acyl-CoA reductase n=1 Tax=Rhodopseudomonas pseudopalustris TaxID=1513892 RepID=UPI003F94AAF3